MSPTDGLALPHTPAAGECLQALPGLSRDPRRSRHEHPRRRARLMASPPVLHTIDPLITGRIELYVDAPPAGVNQIVFYMGTTPGGPYGTEFVNSIVPGVDGTDLIIKADATRRFWIAKAHDGAGYSGPSNEVSTSASAGPPPPPAPTAPGTPTSVGASAGDGQAIVYWTPASNGGSVITGYTVTPYKAGAAQTPVTVDASKASAQVTGLTDGQSYTFTVKATNGIGTSAESSPSSAVTPAAPLTKLQELEDAVGATLNPGDQVAVHLQPAAKVLTVQADGSLA